MGNFINSLKPEQAGALGACIYYLWRPNLLDEADNHVLELAVAARAAAIMTHNRADLVRSELRFPELRILAPAELLKET